MIGSLHVGFFGARADFRGLAVQSEEACRNLALDKVLGVDMMDLSPLRPDWSRYDPSTLTVRRLADLDDSDVARWLDGLDAVLGCETFYVPWFTAAARRAGVATVLQVNPEFARHAYDWLPLPDVIANPTTWRAEHLPGSVHLPVGVARDRLPFRRRTALRTVLHVMGHGAAHDRNGTRVLMAALVYVRHPLGVVVASQRPLDLTGWAARLPPCVDLEVRSGDATRDYWRLYDDADLLVQPRRYGGLHLPAQEALSAGLPVLMPDCAPNGDLLPPPMLVPLDPPRPGRTFTTPSGVLTLADADACLLGQRINQLAARPDEMAALSDEADRVAERLAWPRIEPRYAEALALAAARLRGEVPAQG